MTSRRTASSPQAERLRQLRLKVDERLPRLLPAPGAAPDDVRAAMEHALTGPGKRIRPVLTLAVAEMLGRAPDAVLDVAGAVEMVHACSLVFDDLPSMDDARLRRGREATHRAHGEAVAQLAALALLVRAHALVVEAAQRLRLRRYTGEDMVHHLTTAIGTDGLIGGQALDLASRAGDADLTHLEKIHSRKTGALFTAAAELGAMSADARRRDLDAVTRYAKNLGLAFQIFDDVLDATATAEETGKDVDQDHGKATFVGLLGVAGATGLAVELLEFAEAAIEPLGGRADALRALTALVAERAR